MRRLPEEASPEGRLFNGVWYKTESEYLAAKARRDARRARLLALVEEER